jgi:DNA modification methylase
MKPSSLLDTRVIYCGDNLDQLKKLPDGCVDLIYIDPPFNSNRNYDRYRAADGTGNPRRDNRTEVGVKGKPMAKSQKRETKTAATPGPKPDTIKIKGNWKDAVKRSLQKAKPAEGWPKQ